MPLLDPDSGIAAISRRDKNAERALPEIIRMMGAQYAAGQHVQSNADLAYQYADAMEVARTKKKDTP